MPNRLVSLLALAALACCFVLASPASATVIALYDFEGQNRWPVVEAPGVDAGFFDTLSDLHALFPTGNSPSPLHGFSVCGFVTGNYYEFSVVPEAGQVLDLASLSLDHHATSTGPQSFDLLVATGSGFVAVATGVPNPLGFAAGPMTSLDLSGLAPTTGPVTLRLVGTNASSDIGRFTVDNVQLDGELFLVPEPDVALLLGLGLVGLAVASERQGRLRR